MNGSTKLGVLLSMLLAFGGCIAATVISSKNDYANDLSLPEETGSDRVGSGGTQSAPLPVYVPETGAEFAPASQPAPFGDDLSGEDIDDESKPSTVPALTSKPTPFVVGPTKMPNIDYVASGYNVFFGNPCPVTVGVDQGFTTALFSLSYSSPAGQTADDLYYVPEHVNIYANYGCTLSFSGQQISSTTSYQTWLKQKVSVSGSYNQASFTSSVEYEDVYKESTSSSMKFYVTEAACSIYSASVSRTLKPALTSDVTAAIASLSDSDVNSYYAFIDKYGTHYLSEVVMGARYSRFAKFTETGWTTLQTTQTDVSSAASYDARVSVGVVMDTSYKTEAAQSYEEAAFDIQTISLGQKMPSNSETASDWASSVIYNPMPIRYSLSSISDIIPNVTKSQKMEAALLTYCTQHLLTQKIIGSCVALVAPECVWDSDCWGESGNGVCKSGSCMCSFEALTDLQIVAGAYAVCPSYYSKVAVAEGADGNFNQGAGGASIILCLRWKNVEILRANALKNNVTCSGCVTSLMVIASGSEQADSNSIPKGLNSNGDFNQNSGGSWIYLLNEKVAGSLPITGLVLTNNRGGTCPAGFTRIQQGGPWFSDTNGDFNQGAGGDYLFLCYQTSMCSNGVDNNAPPPASKSGNACFHEDTVITYKSREFSLEHLLNGVEPECHVPHVPKSRGVVVSTTCEKKLRLTDTHLVATSQGYQLAHTLRRGDVLFADFEGDEKCNVTNVTKEATIQTYFGLNCVHSEVLANGLLTSTFGDFHTLPSWYMYYAGLALGPQLASRLGNFIAEDFHSYILN